MRDIQRLRLDAHNWYGVAQDQSRWYKLCQSISFLGVRLWSLALSSVATGGPLASLEM